jgi:hypothetical protein
MDAILLRWLKPALFLIPLLGFLSSSGMDYDREKYIRKSFALTQRMYVEVTNKYGNVEVETWAKDSVAFEISIKVKSEDYSDLDELLKMINVQITNTSGFVLAETTWAENVNFFKKQIYEIGKNLGASDRIEVNYKVKLPSTVPLEIKNEFGDVYLGDYKGAFELDLAHGDFRAHELSNVKDIKVKYGKVKIKRVSTARLDLSYVNSAEIDNAESLYIKSTSSEIEIEKVNVLQINSRHDEYVIDEANEISGSCSLTEIEVERLEKRIDVTSKFGAVIIRSVAAECQLINLEGSSTDYQLGFSAGFSSSFELEMSDNKEFTSSDKILIARKDSGDKVIKYQGSIGKNPEVKVRITSSGGYVKFDTQ